jgi:hypothetical protein
MSLRCTHPQARVRHEHDINGAAAKTSDLATGIACRAGIRRKLHRFFLFLAAFDSKSAPIVHREETDLGTAPRADAQATFNWLSLATRSNASVVLLIRY